jgi:hypothetical protein
MQKDTFEDNLRSYDERFEVTGELLLALPKKDPAEIRRIVFGWKLHNPDDDRSLEDLVMVLVGKGTEVAKVLEVVGKKAKRAIKDKTGWVMLRLHKDSLHAVIATAIEEKAGQLPFFMMGSKNTSLIFDLSNYDVVASDVE